MRKVGPYSGPLGVSAIDGRSREGRLVRAVRRELTAHVGGAPSAAQRLLIDQIALLQLRIAMMDRLVAEGRELSERDSRTYLAWCNSAARLLRQLGLKGAKAQAPARSLADHLAEKRGAA